MKLQNEKLCSKTFQTLINEVNKLEQSCISEKLIRKKIVLQFANIEKVEILHVIHDKAVLLMRTHSERVHA